MPAKKKKTARNGARRKTVVADLDLQELMKGLLGGQPQIRLMTYEQMRDLCAGFIETLRFTVAVEGNYSVEREMISVAGREIVSMMREKYAMDPANAAILLLTMGMGMLQELDKQYDIRFNLE
jgi:hypothetical protein